MGGQGFLQALGIRFLNANGSEVKASGGELASINSIDSTHLDKRLEEVEFIVASDVTNPLLGPEGAVSVFGPQKGVSIEKLADFEAGMKKYADKVIAHTGEDYRIIEGSGAAGGFGFALLSFLQPKIESGFKIISELSGLESHLMDASFAFTGEGKVDAQSLYGKVPIGIGRIAKKYNVATIAFTGNIEGDMAKAEKEGLSLALPIVDEPMTLLHAMEQGPELLEKATIRFMKTYELLKNKGENGHE